MHSVSVQSSGSPKKRTLTRVISEDESLRSIIKEAETPSRRLTRSDSRAGTPKKTTDSQPYDQELLMGLPEMLELQVSYEEVVQELRGLEVERETLLFQVDVLQDTLEGIEEQLAESKRESGQAALELAHEREAKRKLESTVCSLMQEVERLKEEHNNEQSVSANHGSGYDQVEEVMRQRDQMNTAPCREEESSVCKSHSSDGRKKESEEVRQCEELEDIGSVPLNLRRIISKPQSHVPSLALDDPVSEVGVLQRPHENSVEDRQNPSPDKNDSDSLSAYEDASADTPDEDKLFPVEADTLELPNDCNNKEKNGQVSNSENQDPKNPENCVIS